ncbi:conserved hypothetical protein (plasmid) [Rhizobium leguminosarum bv. trifolii WSM1325]|uniref:Uncharacterized protein n=1 Tax=Rhizobium leguminosarum bv. trifolii (strain WSM1325) TaxID=395491 RepID=C6B8P3_RHILS|nr:hypothetical protein [Rhizobium leguminosarum]ACS60281.1 conserved hypothetical protein [Rhizobium leguminosarum bv. trifolii WSM1325]
MRKKQAVVILHGMGEQIPMETLQGFVDAVWVHDSTLIRAERPDSATGEPRKINATWSKPDRRNRSYELRRITTESLDTSGSTDFYEFYWAHLMYGTTWEQVKAWLFDLLWRWPWHVPGGVLPAWIVLWLISIAVGLGSLVTLVPLATLRACLFDACATQPVASPNLLWSVGLPMLTGLVSLVIGAFVSTFLLKYFGDVARYVKADPPNVARRQEIREKGVELLETLMGRNDNGNYMGSEYDRIVVVAHSLGTIIAYDILAHCFARLNTKFPVTSAEAAIAVQPERAALESMIRGAVGLPNAKGADAPDPVALDLDEFQRQQELCRKELNSQGNPWLVSDFITLGSPLTHAEFLLAKDKKCLRIAQDQRVFPTCPPSLEFDASTGLRHFTYKLSGAAPDLEGTHFRLPHHAAHFAYTRWTNLYSRHFGIVWGDIISGPLSGQFGLMANNASVSGIRDIRVLPSKKPGRRWKWPPFFSHTKYWLMKDPAQTEDHIQALRDALALKHGR